VINDTQKSTIITFEQVPSAANKCENIFISQSRENKNDLIKEDKENIDQ